MPTVTKLPAHTELTRACRADSVVPSLSCEASVEVELGTTRDLATGGEDASGSALVNCGADTKDLAVGYHEVVCTAQDDSNNEARCTVAVTVVGALASSSLCVAAAHLFSPFVAGRGVFALQSWCAKCCALWPLHLGRLTCAPQVAKAQTRALHDSLPPPRPLSQKESKLCIAPCGDVHHALLRWRHPVF